jgi:NTP pyrophosphatase (non-canonical NTP hydrolase)
MQEYSKKALRTDYKTYDDFHTGDATPRLDYAAIGLVTESAKVLDLVKKSKKNLNTLNKEQVIEELGDLLWYMNIALDEMGVSFEDIIQSNLTKIDNKYPVDSVEAQKLVRGV